MIGSVGHKGWKINSLKGWVCIALVTTLILFARLELLSYGLWRIVDVFDAIASVIATMILYVIAATYVTRSHSTNDK